MHDVEPKYFENFRIGITKWFINFETRFDALETRLDNLEIRFDALETRFTKLEENQEMNFEAIGEVKEDITVIIDRLDRVERNQEIYFNAIGEMRENINKITLSLDNKVDRDEYNGLCGRVGKLEALALS